MAKAAADELEQLLASDPMLVTKALSTAKAAVTKAQRSDMYAAAGSFWWIKRDLLEMSKYKPGAKNKLNYFGGQCFGKIPSCTGKLSIMTTEQKPLAMYQSVEFRIHQGRFEFKIQDKSTNKKISMSWDELKTAPKVDKEKKTLIMKFKSGLQYWMRFAAEDSIDAVHKLVLKYFHQEKRQEQREDDSSHVWNPVQQRAKALEYLAEVFGRLNKVINQNDKMLRNMPAKVKNNETLNRDIRKLFAEFHDNLYKTQTLAKSSRINLKLAKSKLKKWLEKYDASEASEKDWKTLEAGFYEFFKITNDGSVFKDMQGLEKSWRDLETLAKKINDNPNFSAVANSNTKQLVGGLVIILGLFVAAHVSPFAGAVALFGGGYFALKGAYDGIPQYEQDAIDYVRNIGETSKDFKEWFQKLVENWNVVNVKYQGEEDDAKGKEDFLLDQAKNYSKKSGFDGANQEMVKDTLDVLEKYVKVTTQLEKDINKMREHGL